MVKLPYMNESADPGAAPLAFRCARRVFSQYVGERLLGGFDGQDRRDLHLYALTDSSHQALVSSHENLHHELHWSTVWGVLAAFSGMVADAGQDVARMRAVATFTNHVCRRVHEVFATTVSAGAFGLDEGFRMLVGNETYLGYLAEGLTLGGPEHWPWQFRESAVRVLLHALMQPAVVADIAEAGFERVTVSKLAPSEALPDRCLAVVAGQAGDWWQPTFEELLAEYPDRGGELGDHRQRRLPRGSEAFGRLQEWEETVLVPRLRSTATRHLNRLGFRILDEAGYRQTMDALAVSFRALVPGSWQVLSPADQADTLAEPLGAKRESILLHDSQAEVVIRAQRELAAGSAEFLLGPSNQVLGVYLDRSVVKRQFAGVAHLHDEGSAVLGLAGRPKQTAGAGRVAPFVLLRPGLDPRDLTKIFTGIHPVFLTTLSTTRVQANQSPVTGVDSMHVLIDLPLSRQFDAWLTGGWTLRFREVELHGGRDLRCAVFGLDQLPGCRFLSYRSQAGWVELLRMVDRRRGELGAALELDTRAQAEIGSVTSWLMAAWWRLEEVDHW